ncbi:hypothetical protein SEPCBS119000_006754 [Sporothrix epigloea]|uniref:Uncharacterized protein n=1 Tax=Sporothrix epigloea TaxID=1892477 RepID=A0ABP0E950_9PEZI
MSDLKNTMSDEEQAAEAKSIASQLDAEFKANTDAELRHFLDSVKPGTMADDDLLMLFQGFEDWDVDRFKAADRITLIEVRSLLMQRGIYVANPRNSKDLMAKYLCDTATAEDLPEWPDRALATFSSKTVMKTFSLDLQERVDHSRIDPQYLLPPMTGIRAASPAPPDPANRGKSVTPTGKPDGSNSRQGMPIQDARFATPGNDARFSTPADHRDDNHGYGNEYRRNITHAGQVTQWPQAGQGTPTPEPENEPLLPEFDFIYKYPARPDSDLLRAAREIRKIVQPSMLYSGSSDEMGLIYRTQRFADFCSDNGLIETEMINTIPLMMAEGIVQNHCNLIRATVTKWRLVIQRMATRFETDAVMHRRMNRWFNGSVAEITRANPGLQLFVAVQRLYDDFSVRQLSIPSIAPTEAALYGRLLGGEIGLCSLLVAPPGNLSIDRASAETLKGDKIGL